ncbi:MAG: hypothetical protein E7425_00110, partial [Ruminococcaceae bacterium]|nr:hypothetical protein [Oscillospiraceae bacterium]
MSLNGFQITDGGIDEYGVSGAPDRLSGTAAENKRLFDRLIRDYVKGLYNGLLDRLSGSGGAAEIGASDIAGVSGESVQAKLASLKTLLDAKSDQSTTDKHFKAVAYNGSTSDLTLTTEDGSHSVVMLPKVLTAAQSDATPCLT